MGNGCSYCTGDDAQSEIKYDEKLPQMMEGAEIGVTTNKR